MVDWVVADADGRSDADLTDKTNLTFCSRPG